VPLERPQAEIPESPGEEFQQPRLVVLRDSATATTSR
jgi:hypothetical protein